MDEIPPRFDRFCHFLARNGFTCQWVVDDQPSFLHIERFVRGHKAVLVQRYANSDGFTYYLESDTVTIPQSEDEILKWMDAPSKLPIVL